MSLNQCAEYLGPFVTKPAPVTKKDQIVEALRELISAGDLPRGARIQQDDLAVHFSVSTTPVREALRQLEAEGLVISEPHRGVRVASVDLAELEGVYILRRLVEPYAICRASLLMSRLDFQNCRAILDDMKSAAEREEHALVRSTNHEFHFTIYERSGVPALTRLIRQLWTSYPWDVLQVIPSRPAKSIEEHTALLDAMSEGDLVRIRTAAERHIYESYLAVVKHTQLSQSSDFSTGADPFLLGNGT